jgi:hypothetical protein
LYATAKNSIELSPCFLPHGALPAPERFPHRLPLLHGSSWKSLNFFSPLLEVSALILSDFAPGENASLSLFQAVNAFGLN